jgi:pimeloyl-ACP methyl ester carboxylesterase
MASPGPVPTGDAVIRSLPESVRSVALDRPGYRTSPHPAGTLAENASWLVRELDRASIGDAILVGHSYGGGEASRCRW